MNNLYKIAENVEEYEINILPMIDVIFAILTFFIISSLSLVKLETIPLNLPSASTSSISKDEIINVSISNGKKIFLNKEEVSLEKLNQKLKVINSEKMKKVVISGDKEVAYGVIVEVLDELRKVNNLKIAISTK